MSFFILFIPHSLPLDLVKAVPSRQRVLHRLVYRCFPVLEQRKRDPLATHFIRLEVPLIEPKQAQLPMGTSGGSVLANTLFWSGSSTNFDILMPDRYSSLGVFLLEPPLKWFYVSLMDLRFAISDMNPLTFGNLHGEILNYLNDLEKLCVCMSSFSHSVQ
jgi:hypothetical protein